MGSPGSDWISLLHGLRDQLDQTLEIAIAHATGSIDADQLAGSFRVLAERFAALRPLLQRGAPPPEAHNLVRDIESRLGTLSEIQTRLSVSARQALAQILPQDALSDYARLGQGARGARRGGYR